MNKSEMIDAIASHANLNKAQAGQALEGIASVIESTLKNGYSVSLVGFGNFEVKDRAERKGRNPKTGVEITIAAAKSPSFKPGKSLKYAVNS